LTEGGNSLTRREDSFELAYSLPAKLSIIATVPVMAGLGTFAIRFAISHRSQGLPFAIIFAAIGIWLLYVAYVGVRLLRFLNVRIVVNDSGLEVHHGGENRLLVWADLGDVRRDGVHHVLSVRDRAGQLFLMVDARMSGFSGLNAVLMKRGDSYAT
jgi:hypothetical protein